MTNDLLVSILTCVAAAYVTTILTAKQMAKLGFPIPPTEKRVGCIDGLRGYLAISVFFHHFIVWIYVTRITKVWEAPGINFFNQLGAGGVALFFMTTGFVFYPRILKGFRESSWVAIYITRIFRIMPLVIASVAIITLIIILRTGRELDHEYPMAAITWVLTWISATKEPPLLNYHDSGRLNAYVLWSLSYEWIFYLIVMPICALAKDAIHNRLPSYTIPILLLLISFVARLMHLGSSLPFFLYLPLFAIGMISYECQKREWLAKLLRTPTATIIAILALLLGMIATPVPYASSMPFFGFFFTCVACGNSLGRILRTKGALILGESSYSIYLLHGIFLSILFEDAAATVTAVDTNWIPLILPPAAIAITVLTSLTYFFFERPMIHIGANLAQRWTGRRLRENAAEIEIAP